MNENLLAGLLIGAVAALSVLLSLITWQWFFHWKNSLLNHGADTLGDSKHHLKSVARVSSR